MILGSRLENWTLGTTGLIWPPVSPANPFGVSLIFCLPPEHLHSMLPNGRASGSSLSIHYLWTCCTLYWHSLCAANRELAEGRVIIGNITWAVSPLLGNTVIQGAAERSPLFGKLINSKRKKIRQRFFFYFRKVHRMPFYINVFWTKHHSSGGLEYWNTDVTSLGSCPWPWESFQV